MSAAAEESSNPSRALDELRRELRGLLAMANTAELPKPTVINPPFHSWPGHEWQVNHPCEAGKPTDYRRWAVRVLDNDDTANVVYVSTPGHMPDDFTAGSTTEVRQFAMALLAACDRADHQAAGVPRLEDRRRKKHPTKGDQVT